MTLEFLKAHTGKDGRAYTVGQIADIADANTAAELIRQGVAKQSPTGSKTSEADPADKSKSEGH
jgi:hypothetical protein